jgi:hypothetical protein
MIWLFGEEERPYATRRPSIRRLPATRRDGSPSASSGCRSCSERRIRTEPAASASMPVQSPVLQAFLAPSSALLLIRDLLDGNCGNPANTKMQDASRHKSGRATSLRSRRRSAPRPCARRPALAARILWVFASWRRAQHEIRWPNVSLDSFVVGIKWAEDEVAAFVYCVPARLDAPHLGFVFIDVMGNRPWRIVHDSSPWPAIFPARASPKAGVLLTAK